MTTPRETARVPWSGPGPVPPTTRNALETVIVDDEPDMLGLLGALLNASIPEARVVLIDSPRRALEHLAAQEVDLLITDYKMPGLNGLELAERVHAHRPDLPIILMTAFADAGLRADAFAARIHVFMKKPVDPHEFVVEVRRLLARIPRDRAFPNTRFQPEHGPMGFAEAGHPETG